MYRQHLLFSIIVSFVRTGIFVRQSFIIQNIVNSLYHRTYSCYKLKLFDWLQVRDELEQLLDDDDDMADLYLSRKLAVPASPVSGSGAAWFPSSPTVISKISRASRASVVTGRGDDNDVEELEMLLEVITIFNSFLWKKLLTFSCCFVHALFYLIPSNFFVSAISHRT